jgi:anti-sigma B factor antagonist
MKHFAVSNSTAMIDTAVTVIHLKGDLDTVSTPILESHLKEILGKKRFKIVLDMKNLVYISSAGFAMIMVYAKETQKNKGDIKIAEASPDVYHLFELLEIHYFLKIFKTVNEAVRAF